MWRRLGCVRGFESHTHCVDFSDALKALKEGKKVTRPEWQVAYGHSVGRYLMIWRTPETGSMLMIMHPDGLLYPMSGSHRDILDDDWEIFDDTQLP